MGSTLAVLQGGCTEYHWAAHKVFKMARAMSQQFTSINNHIQGTRAHAYNPSTQNAEGGGSQTQGQSRVHKNKKKAWGNGSVG